MGKLTEQIESQLPVAKRDPTPEQCKAFLKDVRTGTNPSAAASKFTGVNGAPRTASQFGRLARRDADFSAAYADAMAERASLKADFVDDLVEGRAIEADAPPAIVLAYAARWQPGYRREVRERVLAGEEDPLELPRPQIDVSLLTDGQVEELDRILRRAEELVAIGQGRAPNMEREALPAATPE